MRIRHSLIAAAAMIGFVAPAQADIGFADVVVDYYDSGAGPMAGPYGGLSGIAGAFPVAVPVSVVIGSDVVGLETFLSLPTGSYVTVGFTDETVVDGIGDDIFIQEIGAAGETAQVFVTSDFISFFLLGIANDSTTTAFDLASIGWAGAVTGVRIVGLDNFGGSPGFDVVSVQVLPGS
ncbi:MAG: hypothetical protein ACXWXJ_04690, partial [Aeromicrobium sp.]